MNYCTLTESEMQGIEKEHHKKMSKLVENLTWSAAVGDLVQEKHGPRTMGVITRVEGKDITVHWQQPSQNNVSGTKFETLHIRYLELVESGKK